MLNSNNKRGRGRPPKNSSETKGLSVRNTRQKTVKDTEKQAKIQVKRARGRPKKYDILESYVHISSEINEKFIFNRQVKKVDHMYLFEQVMQYLIKMQIVHHKLYEAETKNKPIFSRLKDLDMQMMDICKAVLGVEELY